VLWVKNLDRETGNFAQNLIDFTIHSNLNTELSTLWAVRRILRAVALNIEECVPAFGLFEVAFRTNPPLGDSFVLLFSPICAFFGQFL
jgi:hypothetical protein